MNKYSIKNLKEYTIPTLKKLCRKYDISTKTSGNNYKNKEQLISSIKYKMNKNAKNMNGGDNDVKTIYTIRHGHSCANLLKKKGVSGKIGRLQHLYQPDTPLNKYGFFQAMKLNEFILENDNLREQIQEGVIYCSPLRRCIQTACIALHGIINLTIVLTPYIIEKPRTGYNNDNIPLWIIANSKDNKYEPSYEKYVKNYVKSLFPAEKYKNYLKFDINIVGWEDCLDESDYDEPNINKLKEKIKKIENTGKPVFLFTHSGFITETYLEEKKKNNSGQKSTFYSVNTQLNETTWDCTTNQRDLKRILYPPNNNNIKAIIYRTVDQSIDIKDLHTHDPQQEKLIRFDFEKPEDIQGAIDEGYDVIGCLCHKETRKQYKSTFTPCTDVYNTEKKKRGCRNDWKVFTFEITANNTSHYLVDFDENIKQITKYRNITNRPKKRQHRVNIITKNGNTYELAFNTSRQKNNVLNKLPNNYLIT